MDAHDTIVASATPTGYSGIAVIRLSGDRAISLIKKIFHTADADLESNRAYYGKVVEPDQKTAIDWGIVTCFFAPNSLTGEHVVELSCHGNPLIVDRIINILVSLGARAAEPGEFTRRALLNNKIDMIQAEAVLDTVYASCDEARRLAIAQYEGKLSHKVYDWRSRIIDLLTTVEANIDFCDEENIIYDQMHSNLQIQNMIAEIDRLLKGAESGMKIKEGYRVAIVGRTNVGKSTLFNRLLGYDRAIVHETPGTTRDYLEEGIEIKGLFVRLVDTAGFLLGETSAIDKLSIDRTMAIIGQADLILLVFDGSEPLNEHDIQLYNQVKDRKKMLIINKIDLNIQLKERDILADSIKLSAKTGDNLDSLKDSIRGFLKPNTDNKNILLTRHRHIRALREVRQCLITAVDNNTLETVAFELHAALDLIAELTGKVLRKEILDKIFAEFCIGK